jgi:TfoX/Sxy family transcriptional regulator of competence genes
MAYDERLAARVRARLEARRGLVEKKMFGGLAFLINGNMSVGIHKNELIVRIEPEQTDAALKKPGVRLFDLTGRPMQGWILVGGAALKDDEFLAAWVKRGADFASSLPKKTK